MNMQDCPKFDHCSAPICPLDEDWRVRKHLNGEAVCLWLREHAKGYSVHADLSEQVAECYSEIFHVGGYSNVRVALNRSAKSASKVQQYKERFNE